MAIGYRAILSAVYNDQNLDATVAVLRKWVTQKKGFEALPKSGEVLLNSSGATLGASEVSESGRGVSGYRWTLAEEWEPPGWYKSVGRHHRGVTRVSLVFSSGQLWLWVDVEPPTLEYVDSAGRKRKETQRSGTPAFVSEILKSVEMHDGIANPVSEIQVVKELPELAHLLEVLQDADRRGAVYVTSPPTDTASESWLARTHRILGRIEGMGFGYMLTAEARDAFNKVVVQEHTIPSGAIRTFLPGAILNQPKDAIRHRLLHATTIHDSQDRRLQRIIRNAQVERLRDADLPEALRDADYAFLRDLGARTFDVLHGEQKVFEEGEASDVVTDLRVRLGEAEELLTMALDENVSLRRSDAETRSDVEALRMENEEISLDIADLWDSQERDRKEIEYLRRELSRFGGDGSSAAYGFEETVAVKNTPKTFSQLIENIADLRGVKYFGNRADAEELDEYSDLGGSVVVKAWDALLTFDSYAKARRSGVFEKSLSDYINNTQHGQTMRISKVIWTEGQRVRTNAKMIAQRTVSGLPKIIDPTGSKLLVAHIALATGRAGSPRLYFDDTVAAAGYVTVGYIGTHLDNTLTN